MNPRMSIVLLTALQFLLVALGIGIFLLIKQLFQIFGMVAATKQRLQADITGTETFWSTPGSWLLLMLALPVVLIVARNAASVFYRAGRKIRQIKRDTKARLMLDRLGQGEKETFSLYLRSFSQEQALKRRKGFWWYVFLEGDIFGIDRETLDLMIASEVRMDYPMIALGEPGDRLGAGRLPSSDEEWEALVLLLMQHADVILIVPSTSKGVVREMGFLKKNYQDKTIQIMPPSKYFQADSDDAAQHWQKTRSVFARSGIDLPAYTPEGALFMFDSGGRVTRTVPFEARFGGSRVRDLMRETGIGSGA